MADCGSVGMADELDSGSSARKGVWVQVPSSAGIENSRNTVNTGVSAIFLLSFFLVGGHLGRLL